MIKKTIFNLEPFKVLNEDTNEICYGCNQNWYTTVWQRMAGCGPTTATNLLLYLDSSRQTPDPTRFKTKKGCLALMEDVWKYITPTFRGVSTTKIFYEGLISYAKSKGFDTEYYFVDIPEDKTSRPGLSSVLNFLDGALSKDVPVAFLNLCNGAEKNLDRWHWVTILALKYTENAEQAFINILDNGEIKEVDLALWYNTTTKDGGFVYLKKR
ncbi:MAG: hypothetical protein ACM3X9_11485 [Bacillota bacterium]